jgi:glycosyltransferase involved in cell wall biosynthesis
MILILCKILITFFLIIYFYNEKSKNLKEFEKDKPKISIFLPIYNKEKYLERSIGSIQKQTLRDIEIIPVNDGSTDNSLNILEKLAKKDSRIIIINNEKNSGSLYSRGMGILKSKGEYLMCLDPDDQIRGFNSLKYLYDKAKTLNVDIISFFILYLPGKAKSDNYSNFNEIIKQPELYMKAFDKNGLLSDFYITNKLIKREVLKSAFETFKKYIFGKKWNYYEDNIWSILTYKFANTSVFLNKVVYIIKIMTL